MNRLTLSRGIGVLATAFPERKFDAEIYYELLKDLDDKKFLIAVKDVCSSMKDVYPGTNLIAVIREIVLSGCYLLAGEAWEEVLAEVSKTGSYGVPTFKDPITEKTVRCLGWKAICLSEKIAVERAHFLKIYEQFLDRGSKEEIKLEECKKINKDGFEKVEKLTESIGKGENNA